MDTVSDMPDTPASVHGASPVIGQPTRAKLLWGLGVTPGPMPSRLLIIGATALMVLAALSAWLVPHGVEIAALVVLALMIAATAIRPQWALFIFVLFLPVHNLLMALVFNATGSTTFVKLLQPWKEVVLAVALLRALAPIGMQWLRSRRVNLLRATPLDVVAGLFVALCALSIVLPGSGVPLIGRLYGFRDLVVPFGAFVVGRLALPSARELKALVGVVAADIVAFGLVALGERAFWGNGLLLAVDYGTYIQKFLGVQSALPHNTPTTFYTDGYFPRTGSLAIGPLDVSVMVMIALPIVLVAMRWVSSGRTRWAVAGLGLAALLSGAALVLAWGRESLALVALELIIIAIVLRRQWQWRGIVLVLAGAALGGVLLVSAASFVNRTADIHARIELANQGLIPLVIADYNGTLQRQLTVQPGGSNSGGTDIFTASTSPTNASTVGHLQSLVKLGRLMLRRPQGYGIGSSGQVGNRFFSQANLGGETSYLSVGVELGVLGLLLYVAAFAGAVVACWQVARSRLSALHRALFLGAAIALLAIMLDGVFAEVTLNLFAMYLLWWMSGAALTFIQASRVAPAGDTNAQWIASRPLRVAVDAQCLQTARTGVRTYMDELLKQFARPDPPHTVVPLYGPKRLPSSVRLFRIVNQAAYFLWLHVWLPIRLWLGNFDVLFSPEYLTPIWSPVPRVVTFHDAMFLRRPQDYNPLWLRMFRWVSLPAIRRADAVIVPSRHTAEEAVSLAGVYSDRVYVVPEGGPTDVDALQADEQLATATLARLGLTPEGYVLHVGVLERRKNLVTLIKAFDRWRQQNAPSGTKLVLVGQPGPRPDLDDSKNIQKTIADLGLEEHVVLTGHVSIADRNALYRHAAAVVVPSLMEGFGLPVLEAFAAWVPVVAARSTSLPEVAGDAALFFDPMSPAELADNLVRLANDRRLRDGLVRAGSERVREFTWERAATGTYMVFEAAALGAAGLEVKVQERALVYTLG